MTVKDILIGAAEFCGKTELADYLSGKPCTDVGAAQREEETILRCYNLAENEIALDYLPIRCTEGVVSEGVVSFAALKKPPLEIFSAEDGEGNRLPFTVSGDGVRVRAGKVLLTYSYRPAVKRAQDAPEMSGKANARLLALATACEYALMSGMLDAAALLDKRYRDALACACRERGGRLKMRRWA